MVLGIESGTGGLVAGVGLRNPGVEDGGGGSGRTEAERTTPRGLFENHQGLSENNRIAITNRDPI
jgi:hypothetical protein